MDTGSRKGNASNKEATVLQEGGRSAALFVRLASDRLGHERRMLMGDHPFAVLLRQR